LYDIDRIIDFDIDCVKNNIYYEKIINYILVNKIENADSTLSLKRIGLVMNCIEDSLYYESFCDFILDIISNTK